MTPQPFRALYVHVPFCRLRKCGYCAFYSETAADAGRRGAYLERLVAEFSEFAPRAVVPLDSVFVGGGTPSCLTSAELRRLLAAVRGHFTLAPDAEFSVECNPESLTLRKAEILAAGGVTRLSLGVQSFDLLLRRAIGRCGSVATLPERVRELRALGFRQLNLDLMNALPGQTLANWEDDLRRALDLGPDHLSTYSLTVEEHTALGKRGVEAADDRLAVAMWDAAERLARPAGLRRYEVSNLARPGCECRHNQDIWLGTPYLGCGPAACSFDGILRWSNPPSLARWLRPRCRREFDRLPPSRRAAEVLAFGLRTVRGWVPARFRERTGFDYADLRGPVLRRLVAQGLLYRDWERRLRPTRKGLLFHDTVARELL